MLLDWVELYGGFVVVVVMILMLFDCFSKWMSFGVWCLFFLRVYIIRLFCRITLFGCCCLVWSALLLVVLCLLL